MAKKIKIIKAAGHEEEFSQEKLRDSLERSGASEEIINNVVSKITNEIKEGMTTRNIYNRAFSLIKKHKYVVLRYSLRQAIMELGPTGFPFEKFLGEVLKAHGFEVKVGVILHGFCVTHEVDVLASREDKHIFVEAKYHNKPGIKTDLKVSLYVKARVDDLKIVHKRKEEFSEPIIHEGWLITNTKLTSKARQYGECSGLKVIGWNHPKKGNLQDMILESKVHPISCLTTLNKNRKSIVFDKGIVLCRDLIKRKDILMELGMGEKGVNDVIEEIGLLCGGGLYESIKNE